MPKSKSSGVIEAPQQEHPVFELPDGTHLKLDTENTKRIHRQLYDAHCKLGNSGGLDAQQMSSLRDLFGNHCEQPTDVWEAIGEKSDRLKGLEMMIRGEQRVLGKALGMLGKVMMREAAEEGISIEDLWSQVIMEARAKELNPEEGVPAVVSEGNRSPSNQ